MRPMQQSLQPLALVVRSPTNDPSPRNALKAFEKLIAIQIKETCGPAPPPARPGSPSMSRRGPGSPKSMKVTPACKCDPRGLGQLAMRFVS